MRWFHEIKLQFLDSDLILKNSESGLRPWMTWNGTVSPKNSVPGTWVPKLGVSRMSQGYLSLSELSQESHSHYSYVFETEIEFWKFRDQDRGAWIHSQPQIGIGKFLPTPGLPSGDSLYNIGYILNLYFKLFVIRIKSKCQIFMYITEVFQESCNIVYIVIQIV